MSLEDVARRIVEANRKARAGYDALSARLVEIISDGNWDELDGILEELAPGSGEVPEDAGQAEAADGTGGAGEHGIDDGGEPAQQ